MSSTVRLGGNLSDDGKTRDAAGAGAGARNRAASGRAGGERAADRRRADERTGGRAREGEDERPTCYSLYRSRTQVSTIRERRQFLWDIAVEPVIYGADMQRAPPPTAGASDPHSMAHRLSRRHSPTVSRHPSRTAPFRSRGSTHPRPHGPGSGPGPLHVRICFGGDR